MDKYKKHTPIFIIIGILILICIALDLHYGATPNLSTERSYTSGVFKEDSATPKENANQDGPSEKDYDKMLLDVQNTPHVLNKAKKEIERLMQHPFYSNEAGEIRTYLDRLLELPWEKSDKINLDIEKAQTLLDKEHDGLQKVKDHVLEYLAVQKRAPNPKAPILCFVGPPGVGKTTLAKAIADATGRKFVRISLGGATDESKIRGNIRTYIGSRAGDIVNALKQAGTNNPVILLDEIDKIGHGSTQGDPAAALLEVLDPSQNTTFKDNYIEVEMDLSKVMFIATANSLDIPPALIDRMEIVELAPYTPQEKFTIAKTKLLPKLLKNNGLKEGELRIEDTALKSLISKYTLEPGIRELNRLLDTVCRKVIKKGYESGQQDVTVTTQNLESYLGHNVVPASRTLSRNTVGVTQGLGASDFGGDVIQIETVLTPGDGHLTMTGGLGDFCQESIKAALTVANSLSTAYKFDPKKLKNSDIHIHARGLLAPKIDGTSAGAAITTSIMSAVLNRPVSKDVCMTGEINLRGEVIQVGGIVCKLTAAHAAGIKKALIPVDNMNDVKDLSPEIKKDMAIIPVQHINDVLKEALVVN